MNNKAKAKVKLTREFMIHLKKKLIEIRKNKEAKSVKNNIQYNVILTVCKIWVGSKKYDKVAVTMANELFCLINYFYKEK